MAVSPTSWPAVASTLAAMCFAGCGPSTAPRIKAPPLDPEAVANAAGPPDLIPAVDVSRSILDANGDRRVSRNELVDWLQEVRDSMVAIRSVPVWVTQRKQPLSGVVINLVPESCMGEAIKGACGTTDDTGLAIVAIPGSPYPGVNCGLYRVELTGKGADGRPLPAKYNTRSVLGMAVGGRLPKDGTATFDLE